MTAIGWWGPAGLQPVGDRCACSHPKRAHGTDRRDRPVCFGSSVCGCREFRDGVTESMQRHPAGKATNNRSDQ